ncbi:GtrA family protein [Photobacterium sp. SDRW27]|uniref:GtrA family protein n=1 Tax=Photobacterium obscurum TaxID=2829490 RepID=UPI002243458D|nr:GtrA family protein [Photobacterium obscurum]MCW8329927.1 GtrA family protein [Photobacterium obscurum]
MSQRLLKFGVVGGIGFIVDVASMTLLSLFLPVIPARAGAFWIAATATWWFNRRFTFEGTDTRAPVKQWGRFLLCASIGFVPNWGCYWILIEWVNNEWIMQLAGSYGLLLWSLIAMIPGVLLGMLANFTLANRWVFLPAPE